jgi:steroid 5-alpha reductase family enzyme
MKTFLLTGGVILLYMTCWFIAAQIRGRNDIADVAWSLGFILSATVSLVTGGVFTLRGLIISSLVLIWGIRLALHIHKRNSGKGEDPRYRKWREEWGRWFVPRSFLQVFLLQGVLLLLVATPVVFVNQAPEAPLGWLDVLGLAIWMNGFAFKAIGDWQLLQFIRVPTNKGRLMTTGLWRYTGVVGTGLW